MLAVCLFLNSIRTIASPIPTSAAAIVIIKIVKTNNVILCYGVNRMYHQTYRKAKKIIQSGLIGELQQITIEHGHSNLYWSHPHSVDLMLYFSDSIEIKYIQGNCSFINNYELDDDNFIDNDPLVNNVCVYYHALLAFFPLVAAYLMFTNKIPIQENE